GPIDGAPDRGQKSVETVPARRARRRPDARFGEHRLLHEMAEGPAPGCSFERPVVIEDNVPHSTGQKAARAAYPGPFARVSRGRRGLVPRVRAAAGTGPLGACAGALRAHRCAVGSLVRGYPRWTRRSFRSGWL